MVKFIIMLAFLTIEVLATGETYYVSTDGSDAANGLTVANSFQTIGAAVAVSDTADTIRLRNVGTFTPTTTINFNTHAATARRPIVIISANAEGEIDGTTAVVDGSNISPAGAVFLLNIASIGIKIVNVEIVNSTGSGITIENTVNQAAIVISGCRINNNATSGIINIETQTTLVLNINSCEFTGNGQYGISASATTRYAATSIKRCYFSSNSSGSIYTGWAAGLTVAIQENIMTDGYGILVDAPMSTGFLSIEKNSFVGCTDGIRFVSTITTGSIANNIFANGSGYGTYFASDTTNGVTFENNAYYNNTSGNTNVNGGTPYGSGNVYTNPQITAGYTWPTTSPLRKAGKKNWYYENN